MAEKLACKSITVAVAGTATQADTVSRRASRVQIRNPPTNTGYVYFGDATLAAATRATLIANERMELGNIDLSTLYVSVSINGEKVELVYYV